MPVVGLHMLRLLDSATFSLSTRHSWFSSQEMEKLVLSRYIVVCTTGTSPGKSVHQQGLQSVENVDQCAAPPQEFV